MVGHGGARLGVKHEEAHVVTARLDGADGGVEVRELGCGHGGALHLDGRAPLGLRCQGIEELV